MGGETNHAKYVSVWSVKTVSWKPARNTRTLAAYRRYRIMVVSRRTPTPDSEPLMPQVPFAGNDQGHKKYVGRPLVLSHTAEFTDHRRPGLGRHRDVHRPVRVPAPDGSPPARGLLAAGGHGGLKPAWG